MPITPEMYAAKIQYEFDQLKKAKGGFFAPNIDLKTVSAFLLKAIDQAIRYAEENLVGSPEKKAFVMTVIANFYDKTVATYLPYWSYPFAGVIRGIVLDSIVSPAIDWAVEKMRNSIPKPVVN